MSRAAHALHGHHMESCGDVLCETLLYFKQKGGYGFEQNPRTPFPSLAENTAMIKDNIFDVPFAW